MKNLRAVLSLTGIAATVVLLTGASCNPPPGGGGCSEAGCPNTTVSMTLREHVIGQGGVPVNGTTTCRAIQGSRIVASQSTPFNTISGADGTIHTTCVLASVPNNQTYTFQISNGGNAYGCSALLPKNQQMFGINIDQDTFRGPQCPAGL